MTVIFVITKNKYFNEIEETAQTMCMDFINDIVWCIIALHCIALHCIALHCIALHCIVAYNHFEVELIDDFCETLPPPAIVLCTASPFDPTPKSNFKQDFIRFWATGEGEKLQRTA